MNIAVNILKALTGKGRIGQVARLAGLGLPLAPSDHVMRNGVWALAAYPKTMNDLR
jgi:hypothetical protein